MKDLEKMLSDLFAKLPNLPENVRAFLVKIAPYLAVIGLILSLPAVLALLGFGAMMLPYGMMGGYGVYGGTLGIVFSLASIALLGLSIPGLFARTSSGWQFMYYNTLLSGVHSLLRFDLGGLIIGTGISLYILFQVRSHYK
ncbi:MAG: chromate transporter [Candidatus Yanofskybacteria bacterium]|nr:chromate transporter [Candidatus Yanofskybacteria bacterium]